MAIGLITQNRNKSLDGITEDLDAGTGAAKIRIYDGTRPANADTAITAQVLLAELVMSDPSFPAAAAGSMTANAINDDASANNSGTASWFRMVDSDDNAVLDGDVGTSGSDLNLTTTTITQGVTVSISSMVITAGNA